VYHRTLVGAIVGKFFVFRLANFLTCRFLQITEQLIFNEMFIKHFQPLYKHFEFCGFDISLVSNSWWISIFIGVLNYDTLLTVFDVFFLEGNSVLIKVGLALVFLNEEALYNCRELHEFVEVFQTTTTSFSSSQIWPYVNRIQMPQNFIEMKRKKHLEGKGSKKCSINHFLISLSFKRNAKNRRKNSQTRSGCADAKVQKVFHCVRN
jgi:hypothetical protein